MEYALLISGDWDGTVDELRDIGWVKETGNNKCLRYLLLFWRLCCILFPLSLRAKIILIHG